MSKDSFQILADELTLIRHDMAKLQRTSLDKEEAEALNKSVVQAASRMERAAQEAPKTLGSALKADRVLMASETTEAAVEAMTAVLADIRAQLDQERTKFAQAAGEARRAAWRSFGGFWVWLVAMLAIGAFLGLLAAYATEAGRALLRLSDMIPYACEWTWVGGQLVEQEDGSSFCLFWVETASQAQ